MTGKTILVAIVICLICSLLSTKPVFCSTSDTKIGLFYYVWYGEYDEQNKIGRHWNDSDVNTVIDKPLLGYYSSQNATIVKQHLDWFRELNINFLIVSWWGRDSYEDNATKIVFSLVKRYDYPIEIALIVEAYNSSGQYDFQAICDYINQTYVTPYGSICMKLDGLPLVCFFNDNINMTRTPENRAAIDSVNGFTTKILGHSDYVDWVAWPVAGYTEAPKPRLTDGFIGILPRYDDTHLPNRTNTTYDVDYTEGLYEEQWNEVLRIANESTANFAAIYSWNEYHERSQIEPCSDSTSYKGKDAKFYIFNKTITYISQFKSLGCICPPVSTLSESSYIVDRVGDFWVAQNGTSGKIEFNNTDASTTIQSCINNLTTNIDGSYGGTIFLKSGSIFLKSPLVIPRPNIILEGEGRATGLVGNFSGDIITIESANETPGYQYTMFVKILNILFYNAPNSNFTQTAIHLNMSKVKLWYIDLEDLNIFGMNGIRTDQGDFWTDKTVSVMENLVIRNVIIQNAPSFGIELWSSIDVTMDTVHITFEQNGVNASVDNTVGIRFELNGVSSGTIITNTRVLRAEYGITIMGVRDLWMTNVISDLCKTWAYRLDNTVTSLLTNVYGTSPTGIAFWLTGSDSRENRITTATFKDSAVGVEDDTNNTQYFTGVIAENNSQSNWTTHQNDHLVNCNIIPEFPSFLILPLFFMATLLAVTTYRRRRCRFFRQE